MSPDDPQSSAAPREKGREKSPSRPKLALDVKTRRCLGPCGLMFRSSWVGNRMCANCIKAAAWKRSAIA